MPTYPQLEAEPWWGREVVTPELDWLGDELCRRTGRPRAAFGSKGDNHHLRGAHRSQEWIVKSIYCTNRTYTVQSGLTAEQVRHIAGGDFTPGNVDDMIAQCKRLLAAMKAGQLDEVREFYGNVDGDQVVDGWDNVRDRAATSDSSHLWHWHLTIDRRRLDDRALMERILAIALGDPLEDDMQQTDPLIVPTGRTQLVGETLADVKKLCNGLISPPGTKLGTAPLVPAGSVLDVITRAAQQVPALAAAVAKLGELVARESANPDEVRAIFAALPAPATADEIAEATVRRLGEDSPDDAATALVATLGRDRAAALGAALTAATQG